MQAVVKKILLTETEAAAALGFKPGTLALWRMNDRGPRWVHVSARAVRYRPEDLEAWARANLRTPQRCP